MAGGERAVKSRVEMVGHRRCQAVAGAAARRGFQEVLAGDGRGAACVAQPTVTLYLPLKNWTPESPGLRTLDSAV